jgi:hypothetical protein
MAAPSHAGAAALFAALAVAWTWPLARHLTNAIPGDPGDNYSFVWNLWWMRHVRATPGLEFFRTTYLFHPFGTSLANHPHTALQGFIAATVLGRLPLIAAHNLIVISHVFANLAGMYWLAWLLTRHRRAAILGAVVFGLSPYFSVHLLGHFDLMAGWLLPVFAGLFHLAIQRRSAAAAIGAGAVLAATAYAAYYYVVYAALFALSYGLAARPWIRLDWRRRAATPALGVFRAGFTAIAAAALLLVLWIAWSGGAAIELAGVRVSMREPQNPLTLMWLALVGAAACTWQARAFIDREQSPARDWLRASGWIAAVFAVACAPLIFEAARLVLHREYVTPRYFWRSAPRGVDVTAPFLGHPRHPLTRALSQRPYRAMGVDYIETVAWLGIVPALLLAWPRRGLTDGGTLRTWSVVAAVFALWAAGPFLTVAGLDLGLWLPQSLARYVPFVANARVPGRAMIGVYMAAAVMIAVRVAGSSGRLSSPALQWVLVAIVIFEFCDAPVPMTVLDDPPVYRALAAAPAGAVCEAPFGLGDGLGPDAGSRDRRVLFYATIHAHPLAGGYVGRMPAGSEERYESLPVTSTLLELSRREDERSHTTPMGDSAALTDAPCRYLVVTRAAASPALQAYISTLPARRLASDGTRDLYRLTR